MPETSPIYQPRKPQNSQYYQCVEDNFEMLEQIYDDRFAAKYGFFRPYVRQGIHRFLDCGILYNGFARVRCEGCGHEYLLAFSCNLWKIKARPPPKPNRPQPNVHIDYSARPGVTQLNFAD